MTSRSPTAGDGHKRMAEVVDLSSVFGAAAVSSLRRLRPRRTREAREPDELTAETVEDDVQDPRNRRSPDVPRRRFGAVQVRDRHDVDLLLLAAATNGPANGHELIDLVRERSDGLFTLSVRTVYYRLHWLTNNRLMQVAGNRSGRRYLLTPLGKRVLATRRREWEVFSHGLSRVLEAADP
jgi:DNA-binding PadR family transcriptional regulator